jgi:acyl carrier protein
MGPTTAEVRERLASLINEIAGIPREVITDDAAVDRELQMQSLAFVELQVAVEEAYDIQVDPIQLVELNRFGAIVQYIRDCAGSDRE